MAADETHVRVRLRIRGRVQGVAFRAYAVQEAVQLGVRGWVRNCPDGTVELLAEGNKENVDRLVSWCGHGPSGARVDHIEIGPENFKAEFRDFRITR